MTKLEKALKAVKLRMESAKLYHDLWSDEFLVIEELLNREVVLRKDVEELEKTMQRLASPTGVCPSNDVYSEIHTRTLIAESALIKYREALAKWDKK